MNKTTSLISIALLALIQCAFSATIVNIANFEAKSDTSDTTVAVKEPLTSIIEHTSGTFLNDIKSNIARNNCANIKYNAQDISRIANTEAKKRLEQVSSNCCIITFNNTHLLKTHCTNDIVFKNNKTITTTQPTAREALEYNLF